MTNQATHIEQLIGSVQRLARCPRSAISIRLVHGGYDIAISVPCSMLRIDDDTCTALDDIDSLLDIEFGQLNAVLTFKL